MLIISENVNNYLKLYRELILSSNEKTNLVSRRNVHKTVDDLIKESLLVQNWESCQCFSPIIDIGTGAGFPGIPLKIAQPDIKLTLLDSTRIKTLFLRKVVDNLQLNDVTVVCDRAENLVKRDDYHEVFHTVVSRAAATLKDLLAWGTCLLKPGGELIVWKGSGVYDEFKSCNTDGWSEADFFETLTGPVLIRMQKT